MSVYPLWWGASNPTDEQLQEAVDGVIRDEWKRWQQGMCGTYAHALITMFPSLRFGGVDFNNDEGFDNPSHYVAHDSGFAYDSCGVHPLPYTGVDPETGEPGDGRWLHDMGTPGDFGFPGEDGGTVQDFLDALDHAYRFGILAAIEKRHPWTWIYRKNIGR